MTSNLTPPPAAADATPVPDAPAVSAPQVEQVRESSAPAPDAPVAPPTAGVDVAAVAARLRELFPALFGAQPRPIKLRIQADIQSRAPGEFTKPLLSAFLRRYTGSTAYLVALTKSTERYDLDGQSAGEISEEHLAVAREELQRRRAIRQERIAEARKAERAAERTAEREAYKARRAQREAQAAQAAARQVEDDARRERARLLRDWEGTRLTRANFCTLKGVPEAELDARLEQARREAAEWSAQRAAREAGRGPGPAPEAAPRGPRRDDRAPRGEGATPHRGPPSGRGPRR